MKQPWVATASDGGVQSPGDDGPAPAELRHLPAQDRPLRHRGEDRSPRAGDPQPSGLPADILKVPERGYLKPGYFADVVVFDPKTFRDTATFDKPHQYAPGVKYLFVNGRLAIADARFTGILAGRALCDGAK